ncbi:MAG: bifunctional 5,10-methylene-tetrahydrofolate dehydrogenase/5,10-methylene-tetrahydrofolate cyclohydrolase [Bacteroidia bacterium]|nr:bifunctional 5,10-methylene-tetrahydrofolate dehydrogenase/5,10-methylene-tetrahydrofolate cyclohydrolase [Bacteroidia bacterium]
MSYTIMNGLETSKAIKEEITKEVADIKASGGKTPHLAAILVGDDGASETYIASKVRSCEQIGFNSTLKKFKANISEEELLAAIVEINNNDDIDGLIVQLPLPKHIDVEKVTSTIDPAKDVDGFHPVNIGKLTLGQECYISATPKGIMMLLDRYNIKTKGKHAVVIGRSNIVGRPMSILLSANSEPGNCTVTLCHSKTVDLAKISSRADIVVVALGIPAFLKGNMVKEGAVVIDVGITRVKSDRTKSGFRLQGDVDFDDVAPKCSYITPVPKGVGPMTIIGLLQNTLAASKKTIYA